MWRPHADSGVSAFSGFTACAEPIHRAGPIINAYNHDAPSPILRPVGVSPVSAPVWRGLAQAAHPGASRGIAPATAAGGANTGPGAGHFSRSPFLLRLRAMGGGAAFAE